MEREGFVLALQVHLKERQITVLSGTSETGDIYIREIQWGSEIRTSMDFKWSKRGLAANGPDFEWDLNPESQPYPLTTFGTFP